MGPVIALERSPFFEDVVLTCGDWQWQLWREGAATPLFTSGYAADYYTAGALRTGTARSGQHRGHGCGGCGGDPVACWDGVCGWGWVGGWQAELLPIGASLSLLSSARTPRPPPLQPCGAQRAPPCSSWPTSRARWRWGPWSCWGVDGTRQQPPASGPACLTPHSPPAASCTRFQALPTCLSHLLTTNACVRVRVCVCVCRTAQVWDLLDRSHEPSIRVQLGALPVTSLAFNPAPPSSNAAQQAAQQVLAVGDATGEAAASPRACGAVSMQQTPNQQYGRTP